MAANHNYSGEYSSLILRSTLIAHYVFKVFWL